MVSRAGLRAICFGLAGLAVGAASAKAQTTPVFAIQTPSALRAKDGSMAAAVGISANNAWAVGAVIAHWNGQVWQTVAAPPANATLADVSAVSAKNVWAAGTINTNGTSATLVEHWNGSGWSVVPTPALTGKQPVFNGIAAISPNDVWAAGDFAVSNSLPPLFEHWNGQSWTVSPPNIGGFNVINKLAAVSSTDVWAVGAALDAGQQGASLPLIEHWDGSSWQRVSAPVVGVGGELFGVVALSSTDVWTVGGSTLAKIGTSEITANPTQTLIEHWDGSSWTVIASPNVGPASVFSANQLSGIAALSPTDIWAVGRFTLPDGQGRQLPLAMHWDGNTWTTQPTPNVGRLTSLFGAATAAPSSVWFVGAGGFPGLISGSGPLLLGATGG
jgi:hypothetical protein